MASCASFQLRLQDFLIINISGTNRSISYFLHGDNDQGKVARKFTSWLGVASCAFYRIRLQDSLIFNISGKNQVIFFFFQWKAAPETTNFWLIVTCCVSHPVRLGDSLISNKTGRTNSSLISYMEIIVKGRLPLLVGCGQVCLGANQIPGSFDHQDLWKEITDTSDYCPSFLLIYFYAFFIKYRRVPLVMTHCFPIFFIPIF